MLNDWTPGKELTIHYPTHTHLHLLASCKMRRRRIAVRSVRDLVTSPLTPEEFAKRPYIARSRWLISAYDLEGGCYRQFYLGTMQEFPAPQILRFGAYDVASGDLVRLIGRQFLPTIPERRGMLRVIRRLQARIESHERLAILAPDLMLHT